MSDLSNKNLIVLCSTAGGCPTVEFQKEGVVIRDDFGGLVSLTNGQWADLIGRIERKELPPVITDTLAHE